jgi:hypothetical protein
VEKKVWLVIHDGYDEFHIRGIFSTEVRAMRYVKTLGYDKDSTVITPYMVNNPDWEE